jgi:hypothetical protein
VGFGQKNGSEYRFGALSGKTRRELIKNMTSNLL